MMHVPACRSRKAFTLVELLVVIGIIAVLISILLPSLARARQQALTISCLANLRTVGQALLLYSNNNRKYPYGASGGAATNDTWWHAVSEELGVQTRNADGTTVRLAEVLKCPGALLMDAPLGYRADYTANVRAMPGAQDTYPDPMQGGRPWQPMQPGTIKDSAAKIIVWDGGQFQWWKRDPGGDVTNNAKMWIPDDAEWNGTFPYGMSLYGWSAGFFGWGCADRYESWMPAQFSMDNICPPGEDFGPWSGIPTLADVRRFNMDGYSMAQKAAGDPASIRGFQNSLRYRHNMDSVINVLFADGHAESRKIGEVRVRDLSLNVTN